MINVASLWTLQYLIGGIIALGMGIWLWRRHEPTLRRLVFMMLSVNFFLWLFFIFIHMNASSASFSEFTFGLSQIFAPTVIPWMTVLFLSFSTENKKILLYIVPAYISGLIIFFTHPFYVFPTDYGWSYIHTPLYRLVIVSISVYFIAFVYFLIDYWWRIVDKKFDDRILFFAIGLVVYTAGMVSLNFVLPRDYPPIGGIVSTASFLIFSYALWRFREVVLTTDTEDEFTEFIANIYRNLPIKDKRARVREFKRFMAYTGLNEYYSQKDFEKGILRLKKSMPPKAHVNIIFMIMMFLTKKSYMHYLGDIVLEYLKENYGLIDDLYSKKDEGVPFIVRVLLEIAHAHMNLYGQNTQLQKLTKRLEYEKAISEGVLNAMYEGLIIMDRDFRVVKVNSAVTRIIEVDPDTILGNNIDDLFDIDTSAIMNSLNTEGYTHPQ